MPSYVLPHLRRASRQSSEPAVDDVWPNERTFVPRQVAFGSQPKQSSANGRVNLDFFSLPYAARNEIYRYLLTTQRTEPRKCVWKKSPGSTYTFTLPLLLSCRQMNKEASWIFYRENLFISLRLSYASLWTAMYEMPLVSMRSTFKCPNIAMTVHFEWPQTRGTHMPSVNVVVAARDLPQATQICWRQNLVSRPSFSNAQCWITLVNTFDLSFQDVKQRLLEPMKLLRDFDIAAVNGGVSQEYCCELTAAIMSRLNGANMLQYIESREKLGGSLALRGYFRAAIDVWQTTEKDVSVTMNTRNHRLLHGGGKLRIDQWHIGARVWLSLLIAEAYTKLEDWREAVRHLGSSCNLWGMNKSPSLTRIGKAKMFCLRAKVQRALGKLREAAEDLSEALEADPHNEEASRLLEQTIDEMRDAEAGELYLREDSESEISFDTAIQDPNYQDNVAEAHSELSNTNYFAEAQLGVRDYDEKHRLVVPRDNDVESAPGKAIFAQQASRSDGDDKMWGTQTHQNAKSGPNDDGYHNEPAHSKHEDLKPPLAKAVTHAENNLRVANAIDTPPPPRRRKYRVHIMNTASEGSWQEIDSKKLQGTKGKRSQSQAEKEDTEEDPWRPVKIEADGNARKEEAVSEVETGEEDEEEEEEEEVIGMYLPTSPTTHKF